VQARERHEPGLRRPAEGRTSGMPRWALVLADLVVRSRMASSFWAAAARVVSIAATSPSQPCSFASWSRPPRRGSLPAGASGLGQPGGGGIW